MTLTPEQKILLKLNHANTVTTGSSDIEHDYYQNDLYRNLIDKVVAYEYNCHSKNNVKEESQEQIYRMKLIERILLNMCSKNQKLEEVDKNLMLNTFAPEIELDLKDSNNLIDFDSI